MRRDFVATSSRECAEGFRAAALALLEAGDFGASLRLYDQSLSSARETGDPAFVDWIYACRAAAAAEAGPAQAERVELKRILLRSRHPVTTFRAAYGCARIYELEGHLHKALHYSRIATSKAADTGDPLLISAAEDLRGVFLAADSRFLEASAAHASALRSAEASGKHTALRCAFIKDNLGYCQMALARVDEGLAFVHEALTTIELAGARGYSLSPLIDLCFGYLRLHRYAEARYFGEEALARLHLRLDRTAEPTCLYLLGEACHLGGDRPAGRYYLERLAALYPQFPNVRAYLEVFDFQNVINLRP